MKAIDKIQILLVEDNPADIELTLEAFEESNLENNVTVIEDGAEALDYLYRRGDFESASHPDIILLDINLPHVSGLDILTTIKKDNSLRNIPVIMLTSSEDDMDIFQSYQNYCSGYITKPVKIENFVNVVAKVEGFWFNLVKLASPG